MRLSEAILLGSTLAEFEPAIYISADGTHACALGMAALAIGEKKYNCGRALFARWPWLSEGSGHMFGIEQNWAWKISYEAIRASSGERNPLEKVVAFVRSVEPAEDVDAERVPTARNDADRGLGTLQVTHCERTT